MEKVEYFFDSYAVIELIEGNAAYESYRQHEVTITLFNLAEIYWYAVNNLTAEDAEVTYTRFRECLVEVDDDTLKEASSSERNTRSAISPTQTASATSMPGDTA